MVNVEKNNNRTEPPTGNQRGRLGTDGQRQTEGKVAL
jgi:hypothetical protein